MSPTSPRPTGLAPLRRHRSRGAIETPGLLVAIASAAATFGLGMLILPPIEPDEPPPAPVAPAPAPPPAPTPPPPPPVAATPDAASAKDATVPPPAAPAPAPKPAAEVEAPSKPAAEAPKPAAEAPKPAAEAPKPAAEAPAAKPAVAAEPAPKPASPEPTASKTKGADKDVAREAWRKNLPDITTEGSKSAILIPIRGSIEGAVFHVTAKPKSVLVSLPKAESMITMEFYGIKRDGFRQLWIKKDDAGTSLRIVLGDASDPQVEIKDEFVRVTVRRPTDATEVAKPGEKAGDGSPATPEKSEAKPAATEAPAKPASAD